jgi:hypothetical protein
MKDKNKYPTISKLTIKPDGVLKLLKDININKAKGPDILPNIILKNCANELANGLSCIFHLSIDTGELLRDWRYANVTPVFKKGDRHSAENYRPVSLTSVPSKILEHIRCSHLLKHLEKHRI